VDSPCTPRLHATRPRAQVLALCLGIVATQTPGLTTLGLAVSGGGDKTTKFIDELNNQMRQSPSFNANKDANVYSGGDNYGVIVRDLDDGTTLGWDGLKKAMSGRCKNINGGDNPCGAVGTFWHNDVMAVSQFYAQDPWCDHNTASATWHPCTGAPGKTGGDSWRMPNVGVVVGTWMDALMQASNMGTKSDFPNIQNWGDPVKSWGWGTFYAHDSNAVDKRCIMKEFAPGQCIYDCPGGFLSTSCDASQAWVWTDDASKLGAGSYPAGVHGGGGGGAGCHYDSKWIDQYGMETGKFPSLTGDVNCQCNYAYNDPNGWANWVDVMKDYVDQSSLPGKGWAGQSWVQDSTACWMNNFHDLIRLQNELYWKRELYLDNSVPTSDFDFVKNPNNALKYQGWNEIPFTAGDLYSDTDGINNPKYWDALFIWLPAFTCGIDYKKRAYKWDRMKCVDKEGIKFLEAKLDNYVANGALFPGKGYAGNRPGSSVAIARQIPEWDTDISKWDAKTGWTRQFYCENAKLKKYKIVYDAGMDACYVDYK